MCMKTTTGPQCWVQVLRKYGMDEETRSKAALQENRDMVDVTGSVFALDRGHQHQEVDLFRAMKGGLDRLVRAELGTTFVVR
jgi:hypothetical protein